MVFDSEKIMFGRKKRERAVAEAVERKRNESVQLK
tara:strand:- start:595 stop:699 length:105 start_codon:yes stop_codon:yes gene_type:complete